MFHLNNEKFHVTLKHKGKAKKGGKSFPYGDSYGAPPPCDNL